MFAFARYQAKLPLHVVRRVDRAPAALRDEGRQFLLAIGEGKVAVWPETNAGKQALVLLNAWGFD